MTQPLTIRPLRRDDEPVWRELWTGYLEFYRTDRSDDVKSETFRRLLSADHPDQMALVAEASGRLVGLVHYIFHAHNWEPAGVCYLQDLYAAPEARGRGVGRALIEAVYAAADARGAASVYWMTETDNATARRLYDRIGTLTKFIKYTR